jgi:hypothetical protein
MNDINNNAMDETPPMLEPFGDHDLISKNPFCDAILKVSDGTEFPIHRAVLSG